MVKSVVELWTVCLEEAGSQCRVRTTLDLAYAKSRIEGEGLPFLTIALPVFEKDLLEAISLGQIGSNHFSGFRRRGGLPAFLWGFLSRIFDPSGSLRADADPRVLRAVRQVLLFVSKIELPASNRRQRQAIQAYIDTDRSVGEFHVRDDLLDRFTDTANRYLGSFFAEVELRLWSGDWSPRHSSGALATRESFNSRYELRTWTDRLNQYLPWWDELGLSYIDQMEGDEVTVLREDEEPPVRVALVPKTMKTPRVIAEEPSWMQFVQQGLFYLMSDVLQEPRFNALAKRFSWMDQSYNRALAQVGSVDGSYATIDLSEASDRVSLQHVEALLKRYPYLLGAIKAARSLRSQTPDGRVIVLNKFASMGSSMCFPIESLVFQVLCLMALEDTYGRGRPQRDPLLAELPANRVYGDDLIVPQAAAHGLVGLLEAFGLKVNTRKSFTTGLFRESCGADWFKGVDVSVFKMKHPLPHESRQWALLDQGIQLQQRVYDAGWYKLAKALEDRLLGVYRGIPYAPVGNPSSAFWTMDESRVKTRFHPSLYRLECKVLQFRLQKPLDPLDGYGALRKFFQAHGEFPREKNHLQRDGRGRYVGMNSGWSRV